jgi:alkaline phosphatase
VADFKALADGTYAGGTPDKVLGIAKANWTLNNAYKPGTNDESVVPTLETMTKGAINVLSQDPDGFFLMVEGGAVDWENHANDADAMMAEQVDFDNSVQAVMDWIADGSNGSNWGNTLLIVTADHETGGIWGPGTLIDDGGTPSDGRNGGTHLDDTINDEWQKIVDNGEGNMPGFEYTTGGHTNVLVPLWAKGKGSQLFNKEIEGNDAMADAFWSESQGWDWDGDYVDNTAVFRVMDGAMTHPKERAKGRANDAALSVMAEEADGLRNAARQKKFKGRELVDALLFERV